MIVFVVFLLCSINGCHKKTEVSTGSSPDFKITASFYPLYIMLMNITQGVPNITLSLLAPADTGCLHDYQLTTKDMMAIEKSDAIVINGVGMEHFLEKVLETKEPKQIIVASDGFPVLDENPHVWVSPKGAAHQTMQIAKSLSQIDSGNSHLYMENARTYIEKLESLSQYMSSQLKPLSGTPAITFHDAFPYLADELNLDLIATIEQEHGKESSPKELVQMTERIKEMQQNGNTPLLFVEPNFHSTAAQIISNETNVPVHPLNSAVTGPLEKDSYIDTMKENVETLKKALAVHGQPF